MGFCNCSMFCCALLCVHSSFFKHLDMLLCFICHPDFSSLLCVALADGAAGLSAVFDCGISYSYSLILRNNLDRGNIHRQLV